MKKKQLHHPVYESFSGHIICSMTHVQFMVQWDYFCIAEFKIRLWSTALMIKKQLKIYNVSMLKLWPGT